MYPVLLLILRYQLLAKHQSNHFYIGNKNDNKLINRLLDKNTISFHQLNSAYSKIIHS